MLDRISRDDRGSDELLCFGHHVLAKKDMIITRICGGLGNQMFQYAMGRHLACIHNTDLKLDLSWYDDCSGRTYDLEAFTIKAERASKTETNRIKSVMQKKNDRLIDRLSSILLRAKDLCYIKENYFHYDPGILKSPDNSYLDGYWQSEKYFQAIADTIRNDFSLRAPLSNGNQRTLEHILKANAVSIHVRRGDYASNPGTNLVHGTCSPKYYSTAAELIASRLDSPEFFIFSDDIAWTRDNLKIHYPHTYVAGTVSDQAAQEIVLMSNCKHHIIANSTFSWWGAWLNTSINKTIIAPHQWFTTQNQSQRMMQDLLPASWITL